MLLPELNRRTFFKGAGVLAATVVGTQVLVACSSDDVRGYGGEPRALPIPPADLGTREGSSVHFALEAQTGESQILPDVTTKTWGFNGTHLGPTLVVKKGDDVHVDVTNNLDEMTTVHWHGMKLPAIADGGPHSPIGPGQTWSPTWTVANDAATLWYHPHTHGLTGLHAYRGLAGMIIVEDEATDKLDLPHDYGVDDIPLVLMDHRFLEDGSLDEEDLPILGCWAIRPLPMALPMRTLMPPRAGFGSACSTAPTCGSITWRFQTSAPSKSLPAIPVCWMNLKTAPPWLLAQASGGKSL